MAVRTHSANSRVLKFINKRIEPTPTSIAFRAILRLKTDWLFKAHPQERLAVFASYALRSPQLDRHIEYLRSRAYLIDWWRDSDWSKETRHMVAKAGLDVIDVTQFTHDGRPLNVNYAPIAY